MWSMTLRGGFLVRLEEIGAIAFHGMSSNAATVPVRTAATTFRELVTLP
jgi:hypothetical protein